MQIDKETVSSANRDTLTILYFKDLKNYPKTTRHHKQLQQYSSIQNQLKEISSLSIYQQ
jgi:hypothetical protein